MKAAMPCKLKTFRPKETRSESNEIQKSKHACIVEAHESSRKRLERTLPKDQEDHIAEQGFNSFSPKKSYAQVHSCTPSDENSGCQSRSGQRMGEARKVAGLANDQNKEQREVILEAQKRAKNSPSCYAAGDLSMRSQN